MRRSSAEVWHRSAAMIRVLPVVALLGIAAPANVASSDTDGDGIIDEWERRGRDVNGDGVVDIDFPAMGADPRRKDIFVEVDWMLQDLNGDGDTADPGEHTHKPLTAAIQSMVTAFANSPVRNPDGTRGVTVHVDTGQFGGGNAVTHFYELDFSGTTNGDRREPAIAANAVGALVVWEDDRDQNGHSEIFAQRLTAGGALQGNEFLVNPISTGNQRNPAVAMNAAGVAVVVWEDDQDENGYYEIHAAGYSPGSAQSAFNLGDGSPVNSVSSGQQLQPAVAVDGVGNFVVAWSDDQDGNGYYEIHARGFDNAGAPRFSLGSASPVNTVSAGEQHKPSIAMNAAGNFVIAWEDDQDGNGYFQILARGFDAAGVERFSRGDANPVNSVSAGQQFSPAVAMDDADNVVIAWEDDQDGNGYFEILARGFDGAGAQRFSRESGNGVNSVSAGQQRDPAIGIDVASGDFVVAWADDQDGNGYYQVFARGFTGAGAQRYADLTVNMVGTGQQRRAAVALMGAGGPTIVAWDDERAAAGRSEVWVRALTPTGAQAFAEARAHGRGTNATYATVKASNFNAVRQGLFHYALFVHRRINTGSSGVARYVDDDLIVSLGGFTNQVGSVTQQANTFMHELGHNLDLQHGGNDDRNYKPNYNSVMNYLFQFPGVDTNCDAVGDGTLDYSVGVRGVLDETDLDEANGVCDGTVVVNREGGGQQLYPRVGMGDDGGFVVTWQDDVDQNGYFQVLARGFDVTGAGRFSLEEPDAVNRVSDGQQLRPAVAVAPGGEFVVSWQDDQDENGYFEILARGFTADGVQRFSREQPTPVNSVSSGQQVGPTVAIDGSGRPVIAWQDDQDGNGYWQIHARGFTATGVPRFSLEAAAPVNRVGRGQQLAPVTASSSAGRFVVAWQDDQDGNGYHEILARGFNASGVQVFSLEEPTVVNAVSAGQQVQPAVAMNATGAFVIAWMDDQDKNGFWEVHARAFDANGTETFSRQEPTAVNSVSSGQQISPAVAIDGAGNVIVVWQDDQDRNGYWEILSRGFGAAGAQRFSLEAASPVNPISAGQQLYPSVACSANGTFVVAWQDDRDGNGYYEILARVLSSAGVALNAVAIDWNGDGNITSGVAFDVNNDGSRTSVSDHDDWERIRLDF